MPICDDYWDTPSAKVVCRFLGRSSRVVAKPIVQSRWGKTGHRYALDDVMCKGIENYITDCPHAASKEDCSEGEGAGVVCFEPDTVELSHGSDGFVVAMGRPVLSSIWGIDESQVVCNQLFGRSFSGKRVPIYKSLLVDVSQMSMQCVISNVSCIGNENGIEHCSYNVIGDCPSQRIVPKVYCAICTDNDFISVVQSLSLDGTRETQYKSVVKQLDHLKTKCRNWNCSGKKSDFSYPTFCTVKAFLEDFRSILEPTKDDRVVFLENKFHYGKLLAQNILKQKFSSLKNDITNLGDQTSAFQKSLANHFETVAQFDAIKIQTDLTSLTMNWRTSIDGIADEKALLQKQLADLSSLASKVLIADKIELTVNVILQVIQTFLGGLKDLAGNVAGIHQTGVDIAKSSLKSAQLGFVIGQLPEVQRIIAEIETKIKDNKESHLAINNFFKEAQNGQFSLGTARQFLNHYKDFDGAIDSVKVAKLEEILNFMVDEICSMINDASSVSGNIIAAVKADEGSCLRPKLTITTIITTFNELEEDQKKIMRGYAELAKAKLSISSSENLAIALKNDLNDPLIRILAQARSTFQLRNQKRKLIEEACDEITYLNHGVEESFCKRLKSNIDLDMGKLISYKRKDMCLGNVHEKIVVLPAQFSNKTSLDRLNMGQLLQNSNDSYWKTMGSTFFKIPNEKWLLDYGWIHKGEKGPFYIKKFEIFLPPIQPYQSTAYSVQTQAKVLTSVVNNINYAFPEEINMKYNYFENAHSPSLSCREKLTPYAQCSGTLLNPVCITGKTKDTGPFYPPVTSLWKLDIKSKYRLPDIHSKIPFFLHARVQLCSSGSSYRKRRSLLFSLAKQCCQKHDQYYDATVNIAAAGNNPCKICPQGSSPRLEGYFCEECPVGHQPNKELYGCMLCPHGTHKNVTGPAHCQ